MPVVSESRPSDAESHAGPHPATCLFPPSGSYAAAPQAKGSVSAELGVVGGRSSTLASSRFSASITAAWIWTLRCFVLADILCFRFKGSFDVQHDGVPDEAREVAGTYVVRADQRDSIACLLQLLGKPGSTVSGAASDVSFAKAPASHYRCNVALHLSTSENIPVDSSRTIDPEVDLLLTVRACPSSPASARLEYSRQHTSPSMAADVLRVFQHMHSKILEAPDHLLLQDIDVCSSWDRRVIRNSTKFAANTTDRCLHELIVEQCQLRPNQMAVSSWDLSLTYKELDDLSARLARHLVQLGVRPETFVLSLFEKSTWAIVARLAILRAGGAYVSIHARDPPLYLNSVIERAKIQVMLTQPHFVPRFKGLVPKVVALSPQLLQSLPQEREPSICQTVRPDNACLILFTSGSTGTPKGIVQLHQSYVTAIRNYARHLHMGPHTRFLQFDDYAFDISNLEFLLPLMLGGVCCVPESTKTTNDLVREIRLLKANAVFLTPTIVIKLDPVDVPDLKLLCVGGEPLSQDLAAKWEGSATKLINQYGMGEAAICCAFNDNVNVAEGAKVGRPPNGAIWIVDPTSINKLVPVGAVGEVVIEGPHLARGYLDQTMIPKTGVGFMYAPVWMANMHPERSEARVYRSGDLGRLNADGTITHLGRKDTILKLDGCRIDALEVEHLARKVLSSKDTVVVDLLGVVDGHADPCLAAFLYLDDHPASSLSLPTNGPTLLNATEDPFAARKVRDIKDVIEQSLPSHMVPTMFVLIDHVPRTASRKIDRKKMHMLGQNFYLAQRNIPA